MSLSQFGFIMERRRRASSVSRATSVGVARVADAPADGVPPFLVVGLPPFPPPRLLWLITLPWHLGPSLFDIHTHCIDDLWIAGLRWCICYMHAPPVLPPHPAPSGGFNCFLASGAHSGRSSLRNLAAKATPPQLRGIRFESCVCNLFHTFS